MKKLVLLLVGILMINNVSSEKVAVIGLDGADWNQIEPLMEKGEMPNLREFMENGDSAPLESSYPAMSPVAWSTYTTGTDPSVHGIYDFMQLKDGKFRPTTSQDINKPYFWNQMDRKSVVVNIPMTFPPKELNGALVSGYLASKDTTYTYPAELSDELNSDNYTIEPLEGGFEEERRGDIEEKMDAAVDKRTDAALKLYKRENPDFFQVTYTGLDRLQHYYPLQPSEGEHSEAVPQHYRKLDEAIGRIDSKLDDDTTMIIMSDHGFQKLDREIYLNHWLKERGYMKTEKPDSLLARMGITQQKVAPVLRKLGVLDIASLVLDKLGFNAEKSVPKPTMNSIDLERSKAYAGNYRGSVYIVEENIEDPEEFKEELMSELEDVKIEGEDAFREVKDAEEVYSQNPESAPDILIVPRENHQINGFLGQGTFTREDTKKSGVHRREGILVIDEPGIELGEPRLVDLAPTIADILGEKSPDYYEGDSLVK